MFLLVSVWSQGWVSMPGPMSLLGVGISGPWSNLGVVGVWGMGQSKAVGMYTNPLKIINYYCSGKCTS